MRILIADDQRSVGTTLAALVSHCQHEVVEVVGSGLEAIQAYDRYKPDIVLMDYWMAKLNGATACRNIVSKDPAARVILVSAWSPGYDLRESGAMAVLSKPVDLDRLQKVLDDAAGMLPFHNDPVEPEPSFL
jgi:two-component system chemotaxis response regulator CheY